jgi:predicted glycoside hydrolase/deacetylase ChbG (UPF0249 family)
LRRRNRRLLDSGSAAKHLATIRDGITELVCHPGYADAALSISSYCGQREVELRALRDPGVKGVLAEGGFRCICYGELAAILASR